MANLNRIYDKNGNINTKYFNSVKLTSRNKFI